MVKNVKNHRKSYNKCSILIVSKLDIHGSEL